MVEASQADHISGFAGYRNVTRATRLPPPVCKHTARKQLPPGKSCACDKQAMHGCDILPILIKSCWMIAEMRMIDKVCVLITGAARTGGACGRLIR